jgi:hypothetical protein
MFNYFILKQHAPFLFLFAGYSSTVLGSAEMGSVCTLELSNSSSFSLFILSLVSTYKIHIHVTIP